MKLSNQALEEAVLALLCFSPEYANIVALRIQNATLFSNQTNQKLAETSLAYIQKYSTAPNGQLSYILENDLVRGEQGKLLSQELTLLQKQITEINPEFIVEQLDTFIETQRLQKSLQDSMDLLDQGQIKEAKETLYRQVTLPTKGTSGIILNDPRQALRFLDIIEEDEFFTSGIEVFDRRRIRPARKTLTFMIAPTGKGKTWWMVDVGKGAWQHHKKVLHITLELSEEKTARRYIQSIFSLTASEAQQVNIPRFQRNEQGFVTSIDVYQLARESVLTKRREIFDKLEKMNSYPQFMIKEFPPSTLSIEHLYLYLDSLKQENGFEPDEIIVDYADLMKIDAESLRIDTGRLYRELRGMGVSRNAAMISASQGNKESEDAKLVGLKNAAEDWSKAGTADNVFTFSQTPQEFRAGLARIYAAKCRDAADRIIAVISQAYPFGQFCLDSTPMHTELIQAMESVGN